ncbi:GNAT family N-acetyltransferase [Candidatus Woesearchaeota archaeon]|nr:GNAT family N-acetyltransferase [Candidatus Woesearchaeota archaeon]
MQAIIRQALTSDLEGCYSVEKQSYGPEGASKERIAKRIKTYPKGFLVAELNGKIIGIANGTSTDKEDLSNESLKDMAHFEKDGKNIIIFSLAVLPEHRGKGMAKTLLNRFIEISKEDKKSKILLMCKENHIALYEKFGFVLIGKSKSDHGGTEWHEMYLGLK